MRVVVLGSAAGGGFPQWNSNTPACRRAWSGDAAAKPRTQASLAVSVDLENWFLLNASPDLRAQIGATECLRPRQGLRSSPIAGVVLTGGDVDAVAGLLTMRERHPFALCATSEVQAVLDANSIFRVLAPDCVERRVLHLEKQLALAGVGATKLVVTAFAVPGKVPLWLEEPGQEPDILWRDDEMIRLGVGGKTGRRMGHMSMSGDDGVIAAFRDLGIERKVFIHINNTNPVLLEDSPERAAAEAADWTIAHDGLELSL